MKINFLAINKKINFIILFILFPFYYSFSQEIKVLIPNLNGEYVGESKKGYAHGLGEATGIDHYKGEFKKGLPHGDGTYTWDDGQEYFGKWNKGEKHGYGQLKFMLNGKDTIIEGYWFEDVFLGDKKNPDPLYNVTTKINVIRYTVQNINTAENRVVIRFDSQGRIPTDIIVQESSGSYKFEGSNKIVFTNMLFPFSVAVNYKIDNAMLAYKFDCKFKIEIYEAGFWEIKLVN